MVKYSFQDIRVPSSRRKRVRNLHRDVEDASPHTEGGKRLHMEKPVTRSSDYSGSTSQNPDRLSLLRNSQHNRDSGNKTRIILWAATVVFVTIFVIIGFNIFSGAKVVVTPKQDQVTVDGTFSAYKDKSEESEETLDFDVVILSQKASKEIPAVEEMPVERKASGTIVVYNAHSTASQRLIKRTRFETPDGKVYRINESVTVPGTTVENGKIIPGSLEVTVYADEPGDVYNIGLSDFTIPGFKDDPRYDTFYARSKTDMTGGFSGVVRKPTEEAVAQARQELQNNLKNVLYENAHAQKPNGFILYDDGIFISFKDQEDTLETTGDTVSVSEEATLHGIIFSESDLARFVAEKSLPHYDGSDVVIDKLPEMKFAVVDKENTSPFDEKISFILFGEGTIRWVVDERSLKESLVDVPKKQFQNILANFPHIDRAEASVRPFWKRNFPDTSEKISIEQVFESK